MSATIKAAPDKVIASLDAPADTFSEQMVVFRDELL